jgi:hypothetical protein
MTTARIEARLAAPAEAGLEPHVPGLYARPGVRVLAVAELRHVERTEPAPDSDKTRSVKLSITHLEVANERQEPALREALSALYMQRTAAGTLDEHGELELAERTLALAAGELNAVEAARLRLVARHWAAYAGKALDSAETVSQLRQELKTIYDGLRAAEYGEVGTDA